MGAALRFSSVAFAYRKARVFGGLDLGIDEGEITAVLGPNGTGKTTLLRLAAGILAPSTGQVQLFGRDIATMPSVLRARAVTVVPQETHLAFDFTVREIVMLGRAPYLGLLGVETASDLEVVREAMDRTEITPLANRSFLSLSGGERQRVTIARALAQSTRILLLDEPTAYLDLRHRLSVHTLLTELNRERGCTILLVGHDINLASRHCHRLIILHHGRVVADGSPRDVLVPSLLREVYGVEAEVRLDSTTGRPLVVPLAPTPNASQAEASDLRG